MSKILYIVSARSFSIKNHMRKISDVIKVWNNVTEKLFCEFGGDYLSSKKSLNNSDFGHQDYYDSKIKTNKYLKFFVISISEIKDIFHNIYMRYKLKIKYQNIDLDLVVERSCRLHLQGLYISKLKKIPYVLEWKDHLINYKFSIFKLYAKYIESLKIKHASYIIVESEILRQMLHKNGVPLNKIKVALNAVNYNLFSRNEKTRNQYRRILNLKNSQIVIGYLGSYAFYHNVEMLIELAKIILSKTSNFKFILIGNGKDYKKCKDLAKSYKILDDGLYMYDGVPQSEVPGFLSAMDFTILPGSTNIICPIKIMEYMASRTVVLAPNYSCIEEVIKNDYDGILFDDNVEELSKKIINISNNLTLMNSLALNAESKVKEKFTWEKTWGNVLIDITKSYE